MALLLVASSCSDDSSSDSIVIASIEGRELTRGQLDDLLPDGDNTVDTRVATTVSEWLLAQVVEFELEQRGFGPTERNGLRASSSSSYAGSAATTPRRSSSPTRMR